MNERKTVILNIDIKQAENGIIKVSQDIESLKKQTEGLSAVFESAFSVLAESISLVTESVFGMTSSLIEATESFNQLTALIETKVQQSSTSEYPDIIKTDGEMLDVLLSGALEAAIGAIVAESIPALLKALEMTGTQFAGMALAAAAAFVVVGIAWKNHGVELEQGFEELMTAIGESISFLCDDTIIPFVEHVKQIAGDLWKLHLEPLWENIRSATASVGGNLLSLWNNIIRPYIKWVIDVAGPTVITVADVLIGAVSVVIGFLADAITGAISLFDGLLQFVSGVFLGNWGKAWRGVVTMFKGIFEAVSGIVKGVVNSIILLLNGMIGAIYSAIAGVINAVSGVAEVAGSVIGQSWSFRVPKNPPQIPYLARGAVLPANKPFLAVVGDQRHGTNVEAPLTTIQEAVRVEVGEMMAVMATSLDALLRENRELRRTVERIRIGDEVIGQAARRYEHRMAIIGGSL